MSELPGFGKPENIVLDYPCRIERMLLDGNEDVMYCDRAEFFMDEHGLQWVKFIAKNGYERGKEHMIRTDAIGFTVVRDKQLEV
jgi:hypothetical protein